MSLPKKRPALFFLAAVLGLGLVAGAMNLRTASGTETAETLACTACAVIPAIQVAEAKSSPGCPAMSMACCDSGIEVASALPLSTDCTGCAAECCSTECCGSDCCEVPGEKCACTDCECCGSRTDVAQAVPPCCEGILQSIQIAAQPEI